MRLHSNAFDKELAADSSFRERLLAFLYMNWLRPENVIIDSVASTLIWSELNKGNRVMDVGIGNGYFTFMNCGGRFTPQYDWYFNVNTEHFWENGDIYNSVSCQSISDFIATPSRKPIALAVDHKENLLAQAKQLDFVENFLLLDANEPFSFENIDTVFTNILYWLRDPIAVLSRIHDQLASGARVILVFPNSDFYKLCGSYSQSNMIQKLLNRGRGDCMMWTSDIEEFESGLKEKTSFSIQKFTRYASPATLKIWDIGLRPLSPHLIKMANCLDPGTRQKIKLEWCDTCMKFIEELVVEELEEGYRKGGFNFVVLRKN